MTTILPSARSPFEAIMEQVGHGLSQSLPQAIQQGQIQKNLRFQQQQQQQLQQQQMDSIKNKVGPEIANLPPELQKLYISDLLKNERQQKEQNFLSQLFSGQGSSQNQNPNQQQQFPSGFNPAEIPDESIAKLSSINPNIAKVIQQQKDVALREKRAENKIDYQSFKDNKDYTEKVLGGLEAYKRDKMVLDQMQNLSQRGNLPKPITTSLLNKLGIPIGVLENPDAEQFDKLSQELMKNIQGTYGSRILQSEVQSFMRSIPTLLNSPEGQKQLIEQWQILNEGKKIYYDAYKDIRKENPNRLPPDLHEQVLDRAEPMLDSLADKFKQMSSKEKDESSSVKMKSPDGKIRIVPRQMMQSALQAGGELIE